MPRLEAHGIQQALELLEREVKKNNDSSRIVVKPAKLYLTINLNSAPGAGDDASRDIIIDDVLWWDRFVTLLQQSSNILPLLCLTFWHGRLDNRPDDGEPFTRLFRDVLPTFGPKIHIEFYNCKILPMYLDNIAQLHNLGSLSLCSIDSTSCELILKALDCHTCLRHLSLFFNKKISADAIARLLLRSKNKNGPPIQTLVLSCCSIDSPSCEIILKALDGNQCLQCLSLVSNTIREISMEAAKALGNCKNLCRLYLSNNPLSDQSLCHLAEGLRTNLSLRALGLRGVGGGANFSDALDALAQLLKSFTYTQLCFCQRPWMSNYWDPVTTRRMQLLLELSRHNRTIMTLHEKLFQSKEIGTSTPTSSYQLQQFNLWPLFLKCIGSKPSFIYRFVRHGDLESFMDQVLLASSSGK